MILSIFDSFYHIELEALKIKLEIDTDPPVGAVLATRFHDFPLHFAVTAHDLPSLFAGKSHALLARPYVKGRDWFDFLWYVARKATPNFHLLANALNQLGPWRDTHPNVDRQWYLSEMSRRIRAIDWSKAKADVQRFLRPNDVKTLEHWDADFFAANLKRLES